MRTARVLVIGLICAALLPFTVLLRPAWANPGPVETCDTNSEFVATVARERDKGLTLLDAIKRLHAMHVAGMLEGTYPLAVAIIIDVYSNPNSSPEALKKAHRKVCLNASGVVET